MRVGEFAWTALEPTEGKYEFDWLERAINLAGQHRIYVILGTPSAAPPVWMATKYPDILITEANGKQYSGYRNFGSSRPGEEQLDRAASSGSNVCYMHPTADILSVSISAVRDNGRKLIEDAKLLFDWDRYSTATALAVLAQEEFAKAFLLELVRDDALPWIPEVQGSMARHQCKHLLGIVMEWLPPVDGTSWKKDIRNGTRGTSGGWLGCGGA